MRHACSVHGPENPGVQYIPGKFPDTKKDAYYLLKHPSCVSNAGTNSKTCKILWQIIPVQATGQEVFSEAICGRFLNSKHSIIKQGEDIHHMNYSLLFSHPDALEEQMAFHFFFMFLL